MSKISNEIVIDTLPNGLTLIVEAIPDVESVAYELSMPGGIALDPADYIGSSLLLSELTTRGAGEFNSRELSDAFDARGVRHSESASMDRISYRGAMPGEQLADALKLVSMMVQQPLLPEQDIAGIKNILLQDIASLKDNPARRSLMEMSQRLYPEPYNRPAVGNAEGINHCSILEQRGEFDRLYFPEGSVLSVAGKCSKSGVSQAVKRALGQWKGKAMSLPVFGQFQTAGVHHVQVDSSQLQIVLAWPSCPFGHRHHYSIKVLNSILAGGMFGRLFSEVREKRGLVYDVSCFHKSTRDYGVMVAYAGTTPERAEETFSVMKRTIADAAYGLTEEELLRAKITLKAGMIMSEESTASRASSNCYDWWIDKRVRTLDEVIEGINGVSETSIKECVEEFPFANYSILTLGKVALNG